MNIIFIVVERKCKIFYIKLEDLDQFEFRVDLNLLGFRFIFKYIVRLVPCDGERSGRDLVQINYI